MRKILIIGHARHGKDTVAEFLRDYYGYTFKSSSFAALEYVMYPVLKEKYGYLSMEECYEDRVNHRAEWKQMITDYNTPDKAKLCKEILADNSIYVGMRCEEELRACAPLFDMVVWVDGSKRKPPESKESMTITLDDGMYILDNNGTGKQLFFEVDKLVQVINSL